MVEKLELLVLILFFIEPGQFGRGGVVLKPPQLIDNMFPSGEIGCIVLAVFDVEKTVGFSRTRIQTLTFRRQRGQKSMARTLSQSAVSLVVAMALIATVCPQFAHAADGCKIPALAGAYGLAINGFISFSTSTPPLPIGKFSPISVSGTLTFARTGTVHRSVQGNVGGSVGTVVDSGTYIRNSDCTFTVTHGNGEIWTVTPVKDAEELEFSILSVPGAVGVGAGTMVRKDREPEDRE
jgi:hypothetical protein